MKEMVAGNPGLKKTFVFFVFFCFFVLLIGAGAPGVGSAAGGTLDQCRRGYGDGHFDGAVRLGLATLVDQPNAARQVPLTGMGKEMVSLNLSG